MNQAASKGICDALRELKKWVEANQQHLVGDAHEGFVYTNALNTKLDEMITEN